MICNQCGKNNPFGVKECTYCGAQMPATSACGGFEDIFSYQPPHTPTPQPAQPENPTSTTPPLRGFVSAPPRETAEPKKPDNMQKMMLYGVIGLLVVIVIQWFFMSNRSSDLEALKKENSQATKTVEMLKKELFETKAELDALSKAESNCFGTLLEYYQGVKTPSGEVLTEETLVVTPEETPVVTDPDNTSGTSGSSGT